MNWTHVRSRDVNEAVAERMPVRAGTDADTFAALYQRTFPRVYAYVMSLLRDRSAAEDVTAQAFERAYRKRKSYRARRGSPEAWLFGIARNAALDELRRRGRRAGLEGEPADRDAPTAEDHAELALRREVVRGARQARRPRARPAFSEVLRRSVERRDRACAGRVRDQRGHPAAPRPDKAAKGLR
jgi:RNA polymerase sigma factor (sigma-70 family)